MTQPTNSNILSPKPPKNGFVVGKWDDFENFYAAVPYKNQLMVIHQAKHLKVCRNEQSARSFIQKHQKANRARRAGADGPLG